MVPSLAVITRKADVDLLKRSRIVALLGPRQCGKTTLARQFAAPDSLTYFDLADSLVWRRSSQRSGRVHPLHLRHPFPYFVA
jgi:ABC-type phosphate transport system ATPase subunit